MNGFLFNKNFGGWNFLIPPLFLCLFLLYEQIVKLFIPKFYFFMKTRLFLSREKQGYDKLNTTSLEIRWKINMKKI